MDRYQGIYTTWLPSIILSVVLGYAQAQSHSGPLERDRTTGQQALQLNRYPMAREMWRAFAIGEKKQEQKPPEVAMDLTTRALSFAKRGDYTEAERLFRRSLEITARSLGPDHPEVAALLSKLATLYTVQHRYDEAEHFFRLSLKIEEAALGPEHLDVAANLEALAFVLEKAHRDEEAKQLEARALQIWSRYRQAAPQN